MNHIEARITELVERVLAEAAYCCGLQSVSDIAEKPLTVLVTMSCQHHNTYSFEVHFGGFGGEPEEKDDSVLMRRIAGEIVRNLSQIPSEQQKERNRLTSSFPMEDGGST